MDFSCPAGRVARAPHTSGQRELGYDNCYDDSMVGGSRQNGTLRPSIVWRAATLMVLHRGSFDDVVRDIPTKTPLRPEGATSLTSRDSHEPSANQH